MIRISLITILVLITCSLMSSCGGSSGDPIIPGLEFNEVGTYNEIPSDFDFMYELTDADATPPFRMVLTCDRSGNLDYILYRSTACGMDKLEEHAVITNQDVLALYNYLIQQGYFNYDGLYTVTAPVIPIRVLLVHANNQDIRTEHHTCPSATNPAALPSGFNNIINHVMELGSNYLDSI